MESREGSISPVVANSNEKKPAGSAAASQKMLERLAASHAAVLDKWNCNFALDLHLPGESEDAPKTSGD